MGDASVANEPVQRGPEPTLRTAIGFQFTRMQYYYTNVHQMMPDHADVKPMRRFSFTLPNNGIVDIGSFALHGDIMAKAQDGKDNVRLPDGIQSLFEVLTIYHQGVPLVQTLGYNTVVKVQENLYEDYSTLKHRDIMEHLHIPGVDARNENTGDLGQSSTSTLPNLHNLQRETQDPWGGTLSPLMDNAENGRAGHYPSNPSELKKLVADPKNTNVYTTKVPLNKDENPDEQHTQQVKRPHFTINSWRGFLAEIQPRFLATSLTGDITIEIQLSDEAAIPTFEGEDMSRDEVDVVGGGNSDNSVTKANGTILGLPPHNPPKYELKNLYATVDIVNMADDEFASAARDLMSNFRLEYQFKDYDTEPKKHTGNTNFSHGATSLDNIYCVFRDPEYRSPSPPLRTPDDRNKVVPRFYMSRRNRFLCPNIRHFQFTVNNTKVPQYFATPMDAYWQFRNGRTTSTAKIQSKLDWLYSMFVLPVRFNFPYAPVRLRSGANTRGMNAQMMLDTTCDGNGNLRDIAEDIDHNSGEIAPVKKDGTNSWTNLGWTGSPEMLIIYEKTVVWRIGPGLDSHLEP